MPRVPLYGGQRIQTAPIPGARRRAAPTAESEGAGAAIARARADQTLGALGGEIGTIGTRTYARLAERARQQADTAALLNADHELSQWENDRLYDPQTGALAQKGKAAFELPETIGTEFNRRADEIAAKLATPEQRLAFQRMRQQREQSVDLTVRRHVLQQMQQYQAHELDGLLSNAVSAAQANAQDPHRVGIELARGVSAIKASAPALGLGKEATQAAVEDFTSKLHIGVVSNLLANEQPEAAKVYFEETKSQIAGDAQTKIEQALKEGTLRKQAQREADQIIAAGGTLTEQRAKVKEIQDPDLRDKVEARIEHEYSVQQEIQRKAHEDANKRAYTIVEQAGGDTSRVPPATWAQLTGGERSALREYGLRLAKGVPVTTDLPTYYGLLQQAMDEPSGFSKANLLQFRGKLSDSDFESLAGLQLSIRNKDREAANRQLAPFRTRDQILTDTLSLYGIDPKAKPTTAEGQAIARLRQMVDDRVEAEENLTGKKATNGDIQQIMDSLLSQSVAVPGSWWNIWPGGAPFFDSTKKLIDLTIDDVPSADRALIEDTLRRAGRPVSDATVLDLYVETKARTGGR